MNEEMRSLEAEVRTTDQDIRIVNLTFDLVMYTSLDLKAIPDEVLYVYNRCLNFCPQGVFRWYATENMSKHKPTNVKVFAMLPGWLKQDAPARPILHLHLKDGDRYADAAGYSFWLWGNEPGEVSSYGRDSNVVRLSIPASRAEERFDTLVALLIDLATHFPFDSGHAGYSLETTQYKLEASHRAAFRLSMNHPGLDIANPITDSVALAQQAIKGVNWLTLLSNEMVSRIGGEQALQAATSSGVLIHALPNGLLLQAGAMPRADDGNDGAGLEPYRAIYRVLAPLQAPLLARYGAFDLPGGDHSAKTREWLTRLGHA